MNYLSLKQLASCLFLCLSFALSAQNSQTPAVRNCHAMNVLDQNQQANPGIQQRMQNIEEHTQNYIRSASTNSSRSVVSIPVVVHVLYNTSAENISEAQILSQIQVLNEDFRRTNSDADNKWAQAADSEIEFCLATVDPNGNATTGITRTNTSVSAFSTNDAMKYSSQGGKDAWPTDQYLNIWVCNIGGGILGYAQFPGSGAAATDGVVIGYKYFGTVGQATAPFHLGRTATHEVGHWLNLRHIWGDGRCQQDDFVGDTPSSDGANYGCAVGHTSCRTLDMVENYMDYSDDACMNLFTAGQKARMQAVFAPGGFRESILSSNGCGNNPGGGNGGGTDPSLCATGENAASLVINFDNKARETSWDIKDANGNVVASGSGYNRETQFTEDFCLPNGCYTFTIYDQKGNGICCGGGYTLTNAQGDVLASGASFGSSETSSFCFSGARTLEQEITKEDFSLLLYPNPARQQLNLKLTSQNQVKAQIFDAMGRSVWTANLTSGQHTIAIEQLAEGVYYFTAIQADGQQIKQKFVKIN